MKEKILINGDAQELRDILPLKTGKGRYGLAFFSSPEAMARHAKALDSSTAWHAHTWTSSDSSFYGASMTQACSMANEGWPEGAERAARVRDRINASHPFSKQFARWGVAGAIPNVPRYLGGNPAHMRMIDSAKARRKVVLTLLSDMCVPWYINHKSITNRAAIVAAIVDAIEAAGFACHVIATANVERGEEIQALSACTVKESYQPADIGRLAFGLGHAGMFRRLMFSTWSHDAFYSPLGSSLGSPRALDTKGLAERGIYTIPSMDKGNESKFSSETTASESGLAYLIESLAKQGCPAFPQQEAA